MALLVLLVRFLWPDSGPWEPTTVEYDPACETDCEEVLRVAAGHGQDPEATEGVGFLVNPAVDDPIAQWGDCLESVLACVETRDPSEPGVVRACVTASSCPDACKARFDEAVGEASDLDASQAAFFEVFVEEDGVCVPESDA